MGQYSAGTSERVAYIDVFRGFGILMMVMGHVGFGEIFQHWIHAFHMPMFFFISGYLYKERPLKKTVKRKAKTLLVPYLGGGSILVLLTCLFEQGDIRQQLYHLLWVNTETLVFAGALWFLTAFFISELLFSILIRIKNRYVFIGISVICIIFGAFCNQILPFKTPWGISASFVGEGLMMVGYLLKKNEDNRLVHWLVNLRVRQVIIGAIVISTTVFAIPSINMRVGYYPVLPLSFFNMVGGTILILNASRLAENSIFKPITTFLAGIGYNSMLYLCLNQFVIFLMLGVVKYLGLPFYVGKIVELLLVLICLYFMQIIICQFKDVCKRERKKCR